AGVRAADLTAADVDRALATSRDDSRRTLLDRLLVTGADGVPDAAVGAIELRRGDRTVDESIEAERRIGERLEAASLGPADARAFTNAAFEDATDQAMADSATLFPPAILLVVAVLGAVYRSVSDVLATFGGMVLVTVFVLGAEGWLGPGGLGVLGGATAVGVVIPVLLVGLTVDYALQITSTYRGLLGERVEVPRAAEGAIVATGAAVVLGAVTTAVSFLAGLTSPLGPIRDFGLLSAVGIAGGVLVMIGFVPAMRVVVDPGRGRHNVSLLRGNLLSDVPWLAPAISRLSRGAARLGSPLLALAGAATIAAGVFGAGVDTRFEDRDFLPGDSDFVVDSTFMREVVGGADATVTAVITGDLTDPEVVAAVAALDAALADETTRPSWVAGAPRSIVSLARDLGDDTDRVGSEVLGVGSSGDLSALYDDLARISPDRTSAVIDLRGGDDTTLVTVPVRLAGEDQRREALDFFDRAWLTDSATSTVVGELVLPVIVTDAVTRSQALSTAIVLVVALVLLGARFARSAGRPSLALVAVGPIVSVLAAVIATMRALDVPYNALTATLTALTIGIGVDYTIHVIHRFEAERAAGAGVESALDRMARSTGGALVASAATTIIGFGVLGLAPLPAVAQLGTLTALTVLYALVAALVLVPAALAVLDRP
ncbi:MAG: RND family transporter, partial [Acidimicrobiales bacterium]